MLSELLLQELGGIIRRLENRVRTSPRWANVLQEDTTDASLQVVLEGLEDAICALVMLHIQIRERHSK